ncbi:hypothetical protein ACFW04_001029 [Cataglyphis niger]
MVVVCCMCPLTCCTVCTWIILCCKPSCCPGCDIC